MISVVVPVYNVGKYIRRCLESIAEQSFKDIELILVNDGSKDDSMAVALDYLAASGLKYRIIEQENKGVSAARNRGLSEADGSHVIFVDGDDVLDCSMLELLQQELTDNDADMAFCGYRFIKTQDRFKAERGNAAVYDREAILKEFLTRRVAILLPAMLFRKDFLIANDLWANERTGFSEDQMFIWKTLFKCEKCVYDSSRMYGYYLRSNSAMTGSSYGKIVRGYEEFRSFVGELEKEYPEHRSLIALIMPRWQLGALYTAASLLERKDYDRLYALLSGNSILRRIRGIKEIKAYLLALVASLSPGLLYALCRKLDLNG